MLWRLQLTARRCSAGSLEEISFSIFCCIYLKHSQFSRPRKRFGLWAIHERQEQVAKDYYCKNNVEEGHLKTGEHIIFEVRYVIFSVFSVLLAMLSISHGAVDPRDLPLFSCSAATPL
jgi:hypothetical protein